ncbi:hypothetical protein D3C72_622010 [compost metagenome]
MNVTDVAVDIRVIPVDSERLLRRLRRPARPVFGLHLVRPRQQGSHLFPLPCARFGVGGVCRRIDVDHIAVNGSPDGKRLRLPVFHGDRLFATLHFDPLAVMQIFTGFALGGLLRKDIHIVAESRRRAP